MTIELEILRIIWWGLLILFLSGVYLLISADVGTALMLLPFSRDWVKVSPDQRYSPYIFQKRLFFLIMLILGISVSYSWRPYFNAVNLNLPLLKWALGSALVILPAGLFLQNIVQKGMWQKFLQLVLAILALCICLSAGYFWGVLFHGLAFEFDSNKALLANWGFKTEVNDIHVLFTLLFLSLAILRSATLLQRQSKETSRNRIIYYAGAITFVLILFIVWYVPLIEGFHIKSQVDTSAIHPAVKQVKVFEGLWLDNYQHMPWLHIMPMIISISALLVIMAVVFNQFYIAHKLTNLIFMGVNATVFFTTYPFLLISRTTPGHSLTVWDASANQMVMSNVLWKVIIASMLVLSMMYLFKNSFSKAVK